MLFIGSVASATSGTNLSDLKTGNTTPVASDHAKESVDDPQRFNHHFANVNGIRMDYVEEGKGGRWRCCSTDTLSFG